MPQSNIFQTLEELRHRTAEAVVGHSGLNHPGLAAEIRARFASRDPADGGVMQEAVLEAAPGYVEAAETMADLAGSLLEPATIAALDGAADPNPHRYRFRADWKPYAHQLEAWRALGDRTRNRSVLISSGTGSGKTECFLVPIINDLVREANGASAEGAQAIILYPLNALIASQEERLRDWTAPFAGKVRFCLYNGLLPEELPSHERRARPEAVRDRVSLRSSPPPILVTNVTMLEYMLLRTEDIPILEKSKGKLRYIVLDEAHSYVGARAAEIALLLRRVCLAFGVAPADVRFIATSATIGGADARAQLQSFLADVAGVAPEQVTVIEGQPKWPALPLPDDVGSLEQALETPASDGAYETLARSQRVRPLLEALRAGPLQWPAVETLALKAGVAPEALCLGVASARKNGEALAPLRIHAFHRAIPGLWSCLNRQCCRPIPAGWPFGSISTEDVERCACGAQTFELSLCSACGEPYLEVAEKGDGALGRVTRAPTIDEYALDAESHEPDVDAGEDVGLEGPSAAAAIHHRLVARPFAHARPLHVEVGASRVVDGSGDGRETFQAVDGASRRTCDACHASREAGPDLIRPFLFGAPFVLQNATPVLLDSAGAADGDQAAARALPLGGRQILSFTDSRQGTARLSAKLQVGSERNFVRSFVYHAAQQALSRSPDTTALDLEIEQLRQAVAAAPAIRGLLDQKEAERSALVSGAGAGIDWPDLVTALANRQEVQRWLTAIWSRRDPRFEAPEALAHFLLVREFFRRPRRAISIETLGLGRLSFPSVEAVPQARLPTSFAALGGSLADWRDYLNIILTYLVREHAAVNVSWSDRHWIQPRSFAAEFVRQADDKVETWHKAWPSIRQGEQPLGPLRRPVILLAQGLGVPLEDIQTRAMVQDCLDEAWAQLSGPMASIGAVGRQLDIAKARIVPVREAYVCPVTRRLLDTAFRGLTPYGAESRQAPPRTATKVTLPSHPYPFLGADEGADPQTARALTKAWLNDDPQIDELRRAGVWSDLSDRVALFGDYFRSAEHSAQQSPQRLRAYEAEFKRGEINILNCSTTMEMGVDIGSVSQVMMTNVPPSLASYRQRIGRAGRRRQSLSMGFTFCKDRPLDRAAFSDPVSFLMTPVRAPRVALDSAVIVQRHVNALLFAQFVRRQAGDALKMQAGPFFGCASGAGAKENLENPAVQLARFAELPSTREALAADVGRLLGGSVLEGDGEVFDRTAAMILEIRQGFRDEWEALQAVRAQGGKDDTAMNRGLAIQLKRMCEDYLLSVLSARGFLPSHGFPSGVVSFVCRSEAPKDFTGERARFNSYPQRQLDVAIREYAPGSEIVLDGLVHRSAGVTLNWRRPASPDGVREIQNLLWRWRCRACGESGSARMRHMAQCPSCHSGDMRWAEYLQPAGFAADLSKNPHADPDVVTHVAAEPPAVTISDVEWSWMIDPLLGRMRASRQGKVFFCNAGPERLGYQLCLHCGRAQPSQRSDDQVDDNSGSSWKHPPLLAKADADGDCPGSFKPFGIKPSLRLGFEIATDVFELEISGLQTEGAGLAAIIALRETLAQRLGIETDEMGFAVQRRVGAHGPTYRLFLFDKASGGAGFSSQAQELLPELISGAEKRLNCRAPGCVTGCPSCVLVRDLDESQALILDRQGALEVIRGLVAAAAPQPEDMAASDARLVADLFDSLERALKAGAAELRLRVEGGLDLGELATWSAAAPLRRWSGLGRKLILSVETGEIARMDAASRLALRDRLHEWGATLEEGSVPLLVNGARVLAEAIGPRGALVLATRDHGALAPPDWGKVRSAALVAFDTEGGLLSGEAIGLNRLQPAPGARVKAVTDQLDCGITQFGPRAGEMLRQLLIDAGAPAEQQITALAYSDRYLKSPLVVRLALEAFKALARPVLGEPLPVTLHVARLTPSDKPMRQIWDDWKRGGDRMDVAAQLGRRLGLAVTTREGDPQHGRMLEVTFAGGMRACLLLDCGFGAWEARNMRGGFDFHAPAMQQTSALGSAHFDLVGRAGGTYVVAHLGALA